MIIRAPVFQAFPQAFPQALPQALPRAAVAFALLSLGLSLSGCADMSENVSTAFADPAKYDLYDCKQLETERKGLATRGAELQGLMSKAETGFAGPVVAELAYRNDYVAVRGQSHFAEEAWRKNKCRETPPAPVVVPGKPDDRAKLKQLRAAQQSKAAQQPKAAPFSKSGDKSGGGY